MDAAFFRKAKKWGGRRDSNPRTSPVYHDPNNVAHDLRDFDNIPAELRALPQWVLWKLELRNGKLTKAPYTVTGSMADSTDSQTWATFESCRDALRSNQFFGLGFVFAAGGELTGIDLDKHRDPATGEFDAFAAEYVSRLNSYTEESQSGTGAHTIARATIPDDKGRRDAKSGVEMYSKARFFVMTGKHVAGTPRTIEPRQQAVAGMFREIFAPKAKPAAKNPAPAHALTLTDHDLISKASRAKNGADFSALWRGDFAAAGHSSQSEADAALLSALYFWTRGDKDRSFSLFAQSGLNCEKWQREDYRESTWQLVAHGEVYSAEARTRQAAPSSNRADIASEYLGREIETAPVADFAAQLATRIYSPHVKPPKPTPRFFSCWRPDLHAGQPYNFFRATKGGKNRRAKCRDCQHLCRAGRGLFWLHFRKPARTRGFTFRHGAMPA